MDTDKLLKLADYLETVQPEAFDIRYWCSIPSAYHDLMPERLEPDMPCGTVACALGYATAIFPELTLSKGTQTPIYTDPVSGKAYGAYDAAMNLFTLTRDRAHYIFSPYTYHDFYPTAADVAARIRGMVAEGQP